MQTRIYKLGRKNTDKERLINIVIEMREHKIGFTSQKTGTIGSDVNI